MQKQPLQTPPSRTEIVTLGIDPGIANSGLVVLGQNDDGVRVLAATLVATKPPNKKAKREVRVSVSDEMRYREFGEALIGLLDAYTPRAVGIETYAPIPGRAASGWKTAVVYGVALGACYVNDVLVLPRMPADVKRCFTSKVSSSKADVEAAMVQKVSGLAEAFEDFPATKREHIADAAGHAYLALSSVWEWRAVIG